VLAAVGGDDTAKNNIGYKSHPCSLPKVVRFFFFFQIILEEKVKLICNPVSEVSTVNTLAETCFPDLSSMNVCICIL
jgi:hypothetical protein